MLSLPPGPQMTRDGHMQQLTKAAKNATIYGQLISLIFQSLEKNKKTSERAKIEPNGIVFEQVTRD